MRIVHIATGSIGGAQLAAQRLHAAQQVSASSILINSQSLKSDLPLFERIRFLIKSKIVTIIFRISTKKSFGIFSSYSVRSRLPDILNDMKPNVIHIHNWFNMLSIKQIKQLISKHPVVFTLHDQRLLTGGCHYTLDCRNYLQNCKSCPATIMPAKLIKLSREVTQSILDAGAFAKTQFIFPSPWLLNIFKQAHPNLEERLHYVPNIIHPAFFKSKNHQYSTQEKINVLFVADDPSKNIKGLDILLTALESLPIKYKNRINLIIIGKSSKPIKSSVKHILTGFQNEYQIVNWMKKSSMCVIPSRMDNAPSIVIESQLQKVPVIASKVGGIPDLIEDGKTGFLCGPNPHSLTSKILQVLKSDPKSIEILVRRARSQRLKTHSISTITKLHYEIYKKASKDD